MAKRWVPRLFVHLLGRHLLSSSSSSSSQLRPFPIAFRPSSTPLFSILSVLQPALSLELHSFIFVCTTVNMFGDVAAQLLAAFLRLVGWLVAQPIASMWSVPGLLLAIAPVWYFRFGYRIPQVLFHTAKIQRQVCSCAPHVSDWSLADPTNCRPLSVRFWSWSCV